MYVGDGRNEGNQEVRKVIKNVVHSFFFHTGLELCVMATYLSRCLNQNNHTT